MKAAILHGPKDFRVEEISDPKLEPDGIILRVKAFGICGSELPLYERGLPADRVRERGAEAISLAMTGHEFSGEVAEVGANVTNVKPGDRVTAGGYYGFSEYRSITARAVMPIPDDMSYEVGATIEPVGIGVGLAMKAEPTLGDTVVVLGAGMIGQGTWQVFKAMGASRIIVTDIAKKRLEIARELGADVVINAAEEDAVAKVNEVTSGLGADIVAYCCTAPAAFHQAFEMVRGGGLYQIQVRGVTNIGGRPIDAQSLGGKVAIVAAPPQVEWQPRIVFMKALRIVGNWGGNMRQAYNLMRAGKINTKPLITHEFPLDKINEAFETASKINEAVKVIVKP